MPSELHDYATYQLPWRDSMGSCVRFDKKLYWASESVRLFIYVVFGMFYYGIRNTLFPRWNEFI